MTTGDIILVTGAGGKTGRAVIKLLARTASVRAFVHREDQVATLRALGAASVIVGDLQDGAAWGQAMRGATRVYHVCPNMHPDEPGMGRLAIAAARAAGVRQFAYHSVLHPQAVEMPHHQAKLLVEQMLLESGLAFTILQPAIYMQNLLGAVKKMMQDGVLSVPYSVSAPFSFVDLEDVAEAASIVMTEPGHLQATYSLVGTPAFTYTEVAEIFGRALNRPLRAVAEDLQVWRARSQAEGMGAYAIESLVRMFEYYDRWGLTGSPNILSWILRREPATLEMFAERAVKQFHAVH